MHTIERETIVLRSVARGSRLLIRAFKTADDMHKFLNTGSNAAPGYWRVSTKGLKAGTYAFVGGRWHNVKTFDTVFLSQI